MTEFFIGDKDSGGKTAQITVTEGSALVLQREANSAVLQAYHEMPSEWSDEFDRVAKSIKDEREEG